MSNDLITPYYRIKNWNKKFENNRTRELKMMKWVPVPNQQDSDEYVELVDCKDGVIYLGVWIALLQVASKCDPRGSLIRDNGKPHTFKSLSRMTRISEKNIKDALAKLCSEEIELVEVVGNEAIVKTSQEGAGISQEGAVKVRCSDYGMEGNGMEENGSVMPPPSADPEFEKFWELYDKKTARASTVRFWQKLTRKQKDEVLSKVKAYVRSTPDKKYRCAPATWINPTNERWNDEIIIRSEEEYRPAVGSEEEAMAAQRKTLRELGII